MPLAVSRSDGVMVLTLTSDPSSACPPLCQLLGALCYSPGLCSGSRRLPPQRGGPQTALGALWIITALLHIGLGSIFLNSRDSPQYELEYTYCPLWLGGFFLLLGVTCVLTERYPRPVLLLLSGFLNLTGAALSVTAIVWYATILDNVGFYEMCWSQDYDYWNPITTTLSPNNKVLLDRCQEARLILRTISISISTTLVTLSALDFCLGFSSFIISCKTLRRGFGESKSGYKALLQEDKALLQEDKDPLQEDKALLQEDKALLQEDKALLQEDKDPLQEDKAPLQEDKALLQEDKAPLQEDKALLQEEKALQEDKALMQEDKALLQEDKALLQEKAAAEDKGAAE